MHELIAACYGTSLTTKKVAQAYARLTEKHDEFTVLLNLDKDKLEALAHPAIAKAILDQREGNISIEPGYDGEYGKLILKEKISVQRGLGDF